MEVQRRGCGSGVHRAVDEGLREEIRTVTARLEAVEAGRRRDPELGNDSEEEAIAATDGSDEEAPEIKLLKSVLLASSKPKSEIPNYDGSLSTDVLLDWISELDKYFQNEEISEDNLVATKMVEMLGLKRLKHPTPYKVLWLQKGHQLLVDEQCEVEFHIGKYQDKVVCDIMPMDMCHILLGRPW